MSLMMNFTYALCHYAVCRYAVCRGAIFPPENNNLVSYLLLQDKKAPDHRKLLTTT
jgi:hypothetical protein